MLPTDSSPTPQLLFSTLFSYQNAAALKAAIDLDLFTAIGEGRVTSWEIAERCDASERGIRILCDYLVIQGFLTKSGDHYGMTADSAVFLDRRSPAYMGSVADFLVHPMTVDAFRDLTACVRNGGTVIPHEGSVDPEFPLWPVFARAMMPMMRMPAQAIAEIVALNPNRDLKILDIAASHGLFGLAFAERYPRARIDAVDWPKVLEVAEENARNAGIGDRYHLLPGSAFDAEFGEGYDLVLLTNFLHHFDCDTCISLLRKIHAALGPDGRVATLEFVPNDDRISPPMQAGFSLTMLATTPQGDAYTFKELEEMFKNAGFQKNEIHGLAPSPQSLIVSYK
jgi:2-polyprenyl-3-methyl-5-hydroxy-6-metoxy-1,4-benzoquinol methylase